MFTCSTSCLMVAEIFFAEANWIISTDYYRVAKCAKSLLGYLKLSSFFLLSELPSMHKHTPKSIVLSLLTQRNNRNEILFGFFFHLILKISNIFLLVLLNFCFFYTTESTYVLFCIHFVYHQMIASNEIKLRSQLSERIHLHCWWGFALQFVFFSFFPFSPGFSKEVALLFMDRAQSKAPSSPSKKKVVFQPNDLNRFSTRRHARLHDTTLDEMSNWHGHITIPSTDKVLYPFRWRNAIYLLRSPTSSICLFF